MEIPAENRSLYETSLLPVLKELESIRIAQLSRQIFIVIAVTIAILIGILTLIPVLLVAFLFLTLLIYWIMFGRRRPRFDLQQPFASRIIKTLSNNLYPGLSYSAHSFIKEYHFENSGLFTPDYDIFTGDHMISGDVKGVQLQICNLHTTRRIKNANGNTRYPTHFHGLFMTVELPQHEPEYIYVRPALNQDSWSYFQQFYAQRHGTEPTSVQTDSEAFNRYFKLYLPDHELVHKPLLTGLMTVLAEKQHKLSGPLQCTICHTHLYLSISLPDTLFQPQLYKSTLHFNDIETYRRALDACVDIASTVHQSIK